MTKKNLLILAMMLLLTIIVVRFFQNENSNEDKASSLEIKETFLPYTFMGNSVYNLSYQQQSQSDLFGAQTPTQYSNMSALLNVMFKSKDQKGIWLALELSALKIEAPYTKRQLKEI